MISKLEQYMNFKSLIVMSLLMAALPAMASNQCRKASKGNAVARVNPLQHIETDNVVVAEAITQLGTQGIVEMKAGAADQFELFKLLPKQWLNLTITQGTEKVSGQFLRVEYETNGINIVPDVYDVVLRSEKNRDDDECNRLISIFSANASGPHFNALGLTQAQIFWSDHATVEAADQEFRRLRAKCAQTVRFNGTLPVRVELH
jgi:hypothetical protein